MMFNNIYNFIGNGAISVANITIKYAEWCIKNYIPATFDCKITVMRLLPSFNFTNTKMLFICNFNIKPHFLEFVEDYDIILSFTGALNSDLPKCTDQEILTPSNVISKDEIIYALTPAGNANYSIKICKIIGSNLKILQEILYNIKYYDSNNINSAKFADTISSSSIAVVDVTPSSTDKNHSFPTAKTVILIVLGTLVALGGSGLIIYNWLYKKNKTDINTGVKNLSTVEKQQSLDDDNGGDMCENSHMLNYVEELESTSLNNNKVLKISGNIDPIIE